jgi:hypothetical protein
VVSTSDAWIQMVVCRRLAVALHRNDLLLLLIEGSLQHCKESYTDLA